jgi:hypothetical protein
MENGPEIWNLECQCLSRSDSLHIQSHLLHLTSCTPTKSKLYFANSLAADCRQLCIFYGYRNADHQLGTFFLYVHKGVMSVVKRVEFASDRMPYVILIGRWCNIVWMRMPQLKTKVMIQRDTLSPLSFSFTLECYIRRVQENREGTYQHINFWSVLMILVKYFGTTVINQNCILEEISDTLNSGNQKFFLSHCCLKTLFCMGVKLVFSH